MQPLTFVWNGRRIGIRNHDESLVEGARIAYRAEHGWVFPFDSAAARPVGETWEDAIGPGRHEVVEGPKPADGLRVQFHWVVYETIPLTRQWLELANESNEP